MKRILFPFIDEDVTDDCRQQHRDHQIIEHIEMIRRPVDQKREKKTQKTADDQERRHEDHIGFVFIHGYILLIFLFSL